MYSGISKFLLLAIPFFVLSGNIMAKAGISKRLIKFVDTCVAPTKRRYRHRMCYRSLLLRRHLRFRPCNCCSWRRTDPCNGRTGRFLDVHFTALMATSSSIAIVIPPSIAFVVYASITGTSIVDMFMAGIVPGLLMGVALVIVVMLEAKKHNIKPSREKALRQRTLGRF